MLAQWIGDVMGRMHVHKITITMLAREMGITREYLSAILNGHKEPPGIQARLQAALDRLIEKEGTNQ